MEIPQELRDYPCVDYFDSNLALEGYWDETNQILCILPVTEVYELTDYKGQPLNFLRVGRPGVDGISFGYRKNQSGIWAYYPILGEFQYLSATIFDFLNSWLDGKITL